MYDGLFKRVGWILAGLILATVCYYLPWFTHPAVGLTTNAFDLAEWTSLHPAVRSSSPPMLTSFLLRAPQLALVIAFALVANRVEDTRARWVLRGLALALTLRFFPPSDFFTSASSDPNYRQMALLTGLGGGLTLAAVGLGRLPARYQDGLLLGVLGAGVLAAWLGLSRAGTLLDNFELEVAVGPGIVGFSVMCGLLGAFILWPWLFPRRHTT